MGDLPLSTRARNALARARIRTVGDLEAALKGKWPTNLRGLGKSTLDEISMIAEPYLKNLPLEVGPVETPRAGAGSIAPLLGLELPALVRERAAAVSIEEFDHALPTRALNILAALGCRTLLDVVNQTEKKLLSLKNSGVKTVRQIKLAVSDALARLETGESLLEETDPGQHWKPARGADAQPDWTAAFQPTAAGLRKFVDTLLEIVDQRACQVVMDRHGLWDGTGDTLEDIAGKLGITRERVRSHPITS